jgi:hypothetical protein
MEAIENFGFDSRLCGRVLGTPYFFFLLTDLVYLLILFLYCCQDRCRKKSVCTKLRVYLYNSSFMWNYLLRFFIQMSLDIFLLYLLNARLPLKPWERLKYAQNWLEALDYLHLMFFAAGSIVMTVFIPCFYLKNFSKLKNDDFNSKYGTVYEDMDLEKKSLIF